MKLLLIVVIVCVSVCYAAVAIFRAPVLDPDLRKQGYECQADAYNLGIMKTNETKHYFSPNACATVKCSSGIISFSSCGVIAIAEGCKLVPSNPTKPYPECCQTVKC